MILINDIINELIDTVKSIGSPRLKTIVLVSRLENEVLLNWVSNEPIGLDRSVDLPNIGGNDFIEVGFNI